jgi:hypothetical protein
MKNLVCLLVLVASCGCGALAAERVSQHIPSVEGKKFEGKYENAAGEVVDIPTDKPLVIAFSGKFCQPCNLEITDWKMYLGAIDPEPVKLMTVSIVDSQAKTQDWKKQKGAAWEFGTVENDLFDKYCPENLIPCTLVVKDGEVVHKHIGTASHLSLELHSGKWK